MEEAPELNLLDNQISQEYLERKLNDVKSNIEENNIERQYTYRDNEDAEMSESVGKIEEVVEDSDTRMMKND